MKVNVVKVNFSWMKEYFGTWITYLDPGLAGHIPFFHLVAGQWASSIMVWSLPA